MCPTSVFGEQMIWKKGNPMNPYDEGTPEWLIYEAEGEDDSEPMQFPRNWWERPSVRFR